MQLGSSTHRGILFALIAIMFAFAVPTIAVARVTVPPGATEGDQYFEEVPNGGGSAKPADGGTGNSGGTGGGQPVAATRALNALGKDGQAAAALANANQPPEGASKSGGGQQQAAAAPSPSADSSSSEGEGGMGFWFPLLLVVTVLAAAAYGLRRRLNPA